jgi:uncharacterized protein
MKKMMYQSLHFNMKAFDDKGAFEGYASVFNITDQGGDVVEKGAFEQSLNSKALSAIPLLYQHDVTKPLGVWRAVKEDHKGLWVRGQLSLDTQQGREVYALMKMGALTGLSIGYRAVKSMKDSSGVRHLQQIDLIEISLVTLPMNTFARVDVVKGIGMINGEGYVSGVEHISAEDIAEEASPHESYPHGFYPQGDSPQEASPHGSYPHHEASPHGSYPQGDSEGVLEAFLLAFSQTLSQGASLFKV